MASLALALRFWLANILYNEDGRFAVTFDTGKKTVTEKVVY